MAEKIGQILIRERKITPEQLQEALRTQQFFGGFLGSHLINLGYLEEATLSALLSRIHGVPAVSHRELRAVGRDAASLLPGALALKHRAVPLLVEGDRLEVAMANPRHATALNAIASRTGLSVVARVAPEFRILQAIERLYRVRTRARPGLAVHTHAAAVVAASRSAPRGSPAAEPAPSPPEAQADPVEVEEVDPLDDPSIPPLAWGEPPEPQGEAGPLPKSMEEWRGAGPDPAGPAPPAGPAARSLPEASHSHPPASLEELVRQLEAASSREEICRQIVQFMSQSFRCAAILALLPDGVRVLDVEGGAPDTAAAIRRLSIPFSLPSVFEALREGRSFHLGPLSPLPGTRLFFSALGGEIPPSVLVLPIVVRDRNIGFLYADNRAGELGPVDLGHWKRLAALSALALEIQMLRNKLHSV